MNDTRQALNTTEQATLPLDLLAIQGALSFQNYLQRYHLHPLDVALASQVRYLTIWNMEHGKPVRRVHAERVRLGLLHMTGVPFTAPLALLETTPEKKPERRHVTSVSPSHEWKRGKCYA